MGEEGRNLNKLSLPNHVQRRVTTGREMTFSGKWRKPCLEGEGSSPGVISFRGSDRASFQARPRQYVSSLPFFCF